MTNLRQVEGYKLPRPWFSAGTVNSTMAFIAPSRTSPNHQRRVAPLAEGEREVGWFVLPPFQRPPVWSETQKVRFIESAWCGLPLGVFIFNRPQAYGHPYENWLLDGQQRITAIVEYVADAFPVMGYLFSELGDADYRRWDMSIGFSALETSLTDLDEIREVYDRLAYGGTPHEPKAAA